MKQLEKITKKQKEVLDYIKLFSAKNKYPPSVREICLGLDTSNNSRTYKKIN